MNFEESLNCSIDCSANPHNPKEHMSMDAIQAAEAETDTEWFQKGTWSPEAVIFQCRRKMDATVLWKNVMEVAGGYRA